MHADNDNAKPGRAVTVRCRCLFTKARDGPTLRAFLLCRNDPENI